MKSTLLFGVLLLAGSPAGAGPSEERVFASHLMVDQEVVVTSRITGIVLTIRVDRGAVVVKDQALAELDARDLVEELRESKEEMELRRAEYERARALVESKIISAAELDEKKARYEVAAARWERTKTLRDYAVVRAPFAGIVTEKYARVGQKVTEERGEPLFKLTAVEPLLARVYLPEADLLRVRLGESVEVVPTRFPEAKTTGEVQFISPTVDPASGTFQVMIRVRRLPAQPSLRPGVAVQVRFPDRNPR